MCLKTISLSFVIFLLLSSCSTYSDSDLEAFDDEIQTYVSEEGLKMDSFENGMYYNVHNEGSGEEYIKLTDRVTFHYTGSFLNGEEFQKIRENDAVTFHVRELIVGWQDALSLLKEGGEITIILPPHLGYGSKKTGLIPANSILKYKLKVLEVE